MSNNTKVLSDLIEKTIDAEITRRLGQVGNPVLRASIEDLLRDATVEKIHTALSSRPPKALDIAAAVQQSIDDLSLTLKGKGTALKGSFRSAKSNDNGGKHDSGSKSSPPARLRTPPSRSYGGKGGGYGGK